MKTILALVLCAVGSAYAQAPLIATPAECVAGTVTGKACSPEGVVASIAANGTPGAGTVTSVAVEGHDCSGTGAVNCVENGTVFATQAGNNTLLGITAFTPSTAQTLVAGTAILCNATNVQVTAASAITSTAAPGIANGTDGQLCVITNTGAYNITLQDQDTLASSNLQLSASSVAITPKSSLTLRFNTAIGDWVQETPSASASGFSVSDYDAGVVATSAANVVYTNTFAANMFAAGGHLACRGYAKKNTSGGTGFATMKLELGGVALGTAGANASAESVEGRWDVYFTTTNVQQATSTALRPTVAAVSGGHTPGTNNLTLNTSGTLTLNVYGYLVVGTLASDTTDTFIRCEYRQ
jgi:hypothetical protein